MNNCVFILKLVQTLKSFFPNKSINNSSKEIDIEITFSELKVRISNVKILSKLFLQLKLLLIKN